MSAQTASYPAGAENRPAFGISKRNDMVQAMRCLLGLPFRFPGCAKGLDCGQAIQQAGRVAGLNLEFMPPTAYSLTGILDSKVVLQWARKWGVEQERGSNPRHGDLVLLWLEKPGEPSHAGIFALDTFSIIHARPRGGVVENSFDNWQFRISHVFRFHAY